MADAKQMLLGATKETRGAVAFSNFALNASTDAVEYIFQAQVAGSITRLGVRIGLRTGTPPAYKISLQGVGADGNPDGTIKGGGTPASKAFTPPADTTWNGTFQWFTLDNAYTCTRGEFLAVVVQYDSGTIDGSNNSSFTSHLTSIIGGNVTFPYAIQNDAGARARQGSALPSFGYGTAGTAYGYPVQAALSQSITSTTEAGLHFTLPAGWGDTYKINGIIAYLSALAAGQTLTMTLYTATSVSDVTVLQQVTLDTDLATSAIGNTFIYFDEATLETLSFGTPYRISLKVTAGTNTLVGITGAAAGDIAPWHGLETMVLTSRTTGDWTDTTTSKPLINLILDDITEPAGGGSSGGFIFGG